MTRVGCTLLALSMFAWAGGAHAQLAPPPPSKTITIHNNSAFVVYAVLQAPIQFGTDVHDLWMQAQLGIKEADYLNRPFLTTKLYRAWINHGSGGIPPGGSVTVTVPFYTQLQPLTQANEGKVEDQFVDWWNAMRVYIFDGKDAADAAYNFSPDNPPKGQPVKPVPPYPVTPMTGAAMPTCNAGCTLDLRSYFIGFPNGVPGQLVGDDLLRRRARPIKAHSASTSPRSTTTFRRSTRSICRWQLAQKATTLLPTPSLARSRKCELSRPP